MEQSDNQFNPEHQELEADQQDNASLVSLDSKSSCSDDSYGQDGQGSDEFADDDKRSKPY